MSGYDGKVLGDVIYQRRHAKRLTQEALARAVGLSPDTIFKYENGIQAPGADKVWLLAVALDCTPNDLLGWPASSEN